jgi:hypothetical protein
MDPSYSECLDDSAPERRIEIAYERFQDRLDDLVRAFWLLKILNLDMFPPNLRAEHQVHLAYATRIALALREVGRLHHDLLPPRTAMVLDTLLPTGPGDRTRGTVFTEDEIEHPERMHRDIDAEYSDDSG